MYLIFAVCVVIGAVRRGREIDETGCKRRMQEKRTNEGWVSSNMNEQERRKRWRGIVDAILPATKG